MCLAQGHNTVRPEWGSNPRHLDPESEALTIRPPRSPSDQGLHCLLFHLHFMEALLKIWAQLSAVNVAMPQTVTLTGVDKADYGVVEASINQILLVSTRSDAKLRHLSNSLCKYY